MTTPLDLEAKRKQKNHFRFHRHILSPKCKSSNQCCQITYNCCQRGRAGNQPAMSCDYPTKGTPQGGILSNIVLNELDWWVAS